MPAKRGPRRCNAPEPGAANRCPTDDDCEARFRERVQLLRAEERKNASLDECIKDLSKNIAEKILIQQMRVELEKDIRERRAKYKRPSLVEVPPKFEFTMIVKEKSGAAVNIQSIDVLLEYLKSIPLENMDEYLQDIEETRAKFQESKDQLNENFRRSLLATIKYDLDEGMLFLQDIDAAMYKMDMFEKTIVDYRDSIKTPRTERVYSFNVPYLDDTNTAKLEPVDDPERIFEIVNSQNKVGQAVILRKLRNEIKEESEKNAVYNKALRSREFPCEGKTRIRLYFGETAINIKALKRLYLAALSARYAID